MKKVEKSLSRWAGPFAGPFAGPKRFWKRFAMCEAFASRWCAHGARTAERLRAKRGRAGGVPLAGARGGGETRDLRQETARHVPPPSLGSRVSCQRAGSRFASSGPSARRGNGERLAVAQERDPPGERGAGGLTVAQRWRSPRCGNAQDARCPSDHAQAGGRWMNHDHAFFRNGKSHSLRKRRSVPKKIISGRAKPAPLESLMPMRSIVHAKSAT